MNTEDRVLYFLSSVRKRTGVSYYLNGACYELYFKLLGKFQNAICYYNSDHVITKINEKFYDITGEVKKSNHLPVNGINYSHEQLEKWFSK